MSLPGLCQWLGSTRRSVALHESIWFYPIVESAQVLTLCLFLGSPSRLICGCWA